MWKISSDAFIGCDCEYTDANIILFGAPFDGTCSYRPGSRFAGKAIRSESYGIETYSPYLDRDLTDVKAFDGGDLDFPFGNTEKVLDIIEDAIEHIISDGKKPLLIGGEHLVSLGVIRALKRKYDNLNVIHFDAHTDLRTDYLGETLSHATVLRKIWELVGDKKIYQFGIRSGEKYEFDFAKEHTQLTKYDFSGLEKAVAALNGKPVYLTIDLDVLDPSVFPGTGTPEAGGVTYKELLDALKMIDGLNLVGCDMVELSPQYDISGVSTAVGCKTLRELLLLL